MIVTIVKMNGDEVRRRLLFGERLTGLRIRNLEIENREEFKRFLTPNENERVWIAHSLLPAWRITPKELEDDGL